MTLSQRTSAAHSVDHTPCQNAKTTMERGGPSIMHTTRSGYGAPEPESAAQALARVDTFITHHQACGDLVFQKRVDAPASPKTYSQNSTAKQSPCSQCSKDTRCASRRLPTASSMRTRNMSSLRRLPRSAGSSVLLDITPRSSNSPEQPASPWGKPGRPDDVGPGGREDSADQDSRVVAESGPIGGIDVYRRRPRGV